jgi:hypothetical protein
MVGSLRTLLAGAIDYAGLFPPASLSLDRAIEEFTTHGQSAETWMLARFVCPAEHVARLRGEPSAAGQNWPLAILAGGGATYEAFVARLRSDLASISNLLHEHDVLEVRLPSLADEEFQSASLGRMVHEVVADVLRLKAPLHQVYFEFAALRPELDETAWRRLLDSAIEVLADYDLSSAGVCCAARLKLRTGGTDAAAFLSLRHLAIALCAARDAKLGWKATAGLHHPLPQHNRQLGARMHGFVNLLTAAVLADTERLDARYVEQILEDDDSHNFEWADDYLRWRDHKASIAQIEASRRGALRSFGSCSFDEPRQGLRALGWLDEAVGSRQ